MHPNVRPMALSDCEYMARHMRVEDRAEIRAASGHRAFEAMEVEYHQSGVRYTLTAPGTGNPVGVLGVVPSPLEPEVGYVWMQATPELECHATRFLRGCAPVLRELHRFRPLLTNAVDARNELHIKWLRWLGFTFIRRHEAFGFEQRPFIEFLRLADV